MDRIAWTVRICGHSLLVVCGGMAGLLPAGYEFARGFNAGVFVVVALAILTFEAANLMRIRSEMRKNEIMREWLAAESLLDDEAGCF